MLGVTAHRLIALLLMGDVSLTAGDVEPVAGSRGPVNMRPEVEMERPQCVVMENCRLTVRIVNPNDCTVILPGFEIGYAQPEIQVIQGSGEPIRIFLGDTAASRTPIEIGPQQAIEIRRFLYDSVTMPRWPFAAGQFRLTAKPPVFRARVGSDGESVPIDWECYATAMEVTLWDGRDQAASLFLQEQFARRAESVRTGATQSYSIWAINVFREFLKRFRASAYAAEIRWELAKLLEREIEDQHGPLYGDAQMVELWTECMTFCLDRGGAFVQEFLRWDWDRGGSHALQVARRFRQWGLLKRLVTDLDRKYADDEAAKLWRRVLVAGATGDPHEAQKVGDELSRRFPDSPYARDIPDLLRTLERERSDVPASGRGTP